MRLGVMFDHSREPEELVGFAQALDELGVDDLWVVEDLGWAGGISSAAVALASTRRLRLGIGIMPAPLRNPALLAMEVATLGRLYPGRFAAGIGHGVAEWMAQVGAATPNKLALLDQTIIAVRSLLRGSRLTMADNSAVTIDGLQLEHPPAEPPPVLAGVVRPRSLVLSGRAADGTIIAEGHGPDDLPGLLAHIQKGRDESRDRPGAPRDHELVVFTFLCVDDDPRARSADVLAGQAAWLGVGPDELYLAGGSAEQAAEQVRALWTAGAATVALRPIGDDPLGQVRAVLGALGPER
jgi:alkanesulfonate monooxygenase SsuD/methylene tetrahydromethanopterin reductase-like flavin-dependent oxidoreductase (luciferase family)